jgi:serine phosphatase RsbU (regulator of sigma subunit)
MVAVLADVTGHGIGPALLAAVCRAYARANFRIGRGLFPAIQQLNSELTGDIGEGRFVTLVAAVCVPDDPHIQLLSAGHGPLFHYAFNEDRFEEMYAQGPPLGISPELSSDEPKILELNRGDLLVFATDGFFEWANQETEQFGFRRLEEAVRQSRDKSPSQIISALYGAVIEFSGGTKQSDDLTALVIKRI